MDCRSSSPTPKLGRRHGARACALRVAIAHRARTSSFFGKPVAYAPVLFASYDEYRGYTMAHFARMYEALDVQPDEAHLDLLFRPGPEPAAHLAEVIETIEPGLVFVDTLHHVLAAPDVNDYTAVADAMQVLRRVADRNDCHIALLHHARKDPAAEGVAAVSGSARLAGDVDQIITLKRKPDGVRTLTATGRGPDVGPLVVALDSETGLVTNDGPPGQTNDPRPRTRSHAARRDADLADYLTSTKTETITADVVAEALEWTLDRAHAEGAPSPSWPVGPRRPRGPRAPGPSWPDAGTPRSKARGRATRVRSPCAIAPVFALSPSPKACAPPPLRRA